MKSLFVILASSFAIMSSASASNVFYSCKIIEGGTPRFGIDKVVITVGEGLFKGRLLLNLIKTLPNGSTEISTPAVYAHSANIHKGRYAGFQKFTPSERFAVPQLFAEKFPSFAFEASVDEKIAFAAFPESKNAAYFCKLN